ncbi:hypothetical protein G6F31_015223 [Rhizopus arrhizus]|nr:hypothetical protein G6F31_015223 [Rhizopus arrhizus]
MSSTRVQPSDSNLKYGLDSRVRRLLVASALALQDGAELFGEGLEPHRHALHAGGEAVVGPHRRNRHEQADGGGKERFGDTRRNRGDAGLRAAADHVVHGHHDAEHGTDQAHVRGGRADVGQQFQVALELVHFAGVGGAHGTLRAFQLRTAIQPALVAQAGVLAEAGFEDRLQAADVAAAISGRAVQLAQVGAGPEAVLELVGFAGGLLEHAGLAENDHPADERADQQQQHDDLHRQAGLGHQFEVVDAAAGGGLGKGLCRGVADVGRQCLGDRGLQGQERCDHPLFLSVRIRGGGGVAAPQGRIRPCRAGGNWPLPVRRCGPGPTAAARRRAGSAGRRPCWPSSAGPAWRSPAGCHPAVLA